MSVKYLPKVQKADTGAAVNPSTGAGPTGIPGLTYDPNDPNTPANQLDLLKILATLQNNEVQNSMGKRGTPGTPVMPPIEQILNAQQSRAQAQANSYAPGTEYLNGAEPGGLADVMSQFMGKVSGKPGPTLSDANRRVNTVSLDNLGSTFDDAMAHANDVLANVKMFGGTPDIAPGPGQFGDLIASTLGKLTAGKASAMTGDDFMSKVFGTDYTPGAITHYNGEGPNAYQKQDIAAQEASDKAKRDAELRSKGGGGLMSLLGDAPSGALDLGKFLTSLPMKGEQALKPNLAGAQSSGGGPAIPNGIKVEATSGNGRGQAEEQQREAQHQVQTNTPSDNTLSTLVDLVRNSGGQGAGLLTDLFSRFLQPNVNGATSGGSGPSRTFRGAGGGGGGGGGSADGPYTWDGRLKKVVPVVRKQANGGVTAAPAYAGPQILHVGERSPKDKNYETSEVVLAAPGTVVAPIPKGMKNPSPEDAAGLLMAQIFKTFAGTNAANGDQSAADGGQPRHAAVGAMDTYDTGQESSGSGSSGYLTQPDDFSSYLNQLMSGAGTMANYGLGEDQNDTTRMLGLGRNANDAQSNANTRYGIDVQARTAGQQNQIQQGDLWLRQLLGMRGLQDEETKNSQDFTLGQGNLAQRKNEANMTNATNQRQLDLQTAQQHFNNIMAGLSSASVPLISRAVPTQGPLG